MANTDRPFGFKPVRYSSGRAYTGAARRYKKEASTIIGIGDPVVITGTAEATTAIALVDRAAAGSGTITGVVVGMDPQRSDLSKNHLAAADTGYVMVADDPDLVFEIQEDGDSGTIAITDVGEFCDIVVADANTTTGMSQVELDSSNAGTGDQVRIMGMVQREDNELGANAKWEVMINEHTYKSVQTPI
jgi:hypothetical protein